MRLRISEVSLYLRMEHASIICARFWALQIYLLNLPPYVPYLAYIVALYVFFGSDIAHKTRDIRDPTQAIQAMKITKRLLVVTAAVRK